MEILIPLAILFGGFMLVQVAGSYFDWRLEQKQDQEIRRQDAIDAKAHEQEYLHLCGFAPDECDDYHLPGDRPLCGAA